MPEVSDNKRIAKNTLLLYLRLFYSLLLSLFTARVLLQALGFTDYGLYNVVGSVITMFTFIRSTMGNATNRYIAYGVGKGDTEELRKLFSTCVIVHLIIAFLIVILCEAVGLWLLFNKMEVPADRLNACFWVLQLSIATCAIGVVCVPYDADIIAHEKMGAFAFISMLNSTLNLGVVFAVKYFPFDKLIFYAFLVFSIQVLNRVIYNIYCHRNFPESRFCIIVDKSKIKEMFKFAFWNLFGNMADFVCVPILNIILNMFFGPVINAARAIAVNVQGTINGFISNFELAVVPQITKSCASGNIQRMQKLIVTSSKFSYFLFFFTALPLLLEARQILTLWLGNFPDHTIAFMRITLLTLLVYSWSHILHTANLATGKIKKFQIVRGVVTFLMLPISFIALKRGAVPEVVFIVQLLTIYASQIAMLIMIHPLINLSLKEYAIEVYIRSCVVSVCAAIPSYLIFKLLPESVWSLIIVCVACVFFTAMSVFFLGINKSEKDMLFSYMKPVLARFLK